MGVGTGIVLVAIGAILDFAVDVQTSSVNLHTIGVILMIVGAVAFFVSLFFWSSWGGFGGGYRRSRREFHDGRDTYVEERGHY